MMNMSVSKKNRNKQMEFLTLFAMILVVIGHSDITMDFKELVIFKWVYSFHMPLFFFISGFLFCYTNDVAKLKQTSYVGFLYKKLIRLMIPFLFINTIIFLVKAVVIKDNSMMQNPTHLTIHSFIYHTFFAPTGFMWFLPCLFIVFLAVFPLWKYLNYKNLVSSWTNVLLIIVMTIVCLCLIDYFLHYISFMQISNAIRYSIFFLIGILYCKFESKIYSFLKKYIYIILPLSFFISIYLAFLGADWVGVKKFAAIIGIIFSLTLSIGLADKCSKYLYLSSFVYTVFLLSYFPQMLVRGPVYHRYPEVNQYVYSFLSFFLGLFLPLCFALLYMAAKKKWNSISFIGVLFGL